MWVSWLVSSKKGVGMDILCIIQINSSPDGLTDTFSCRRMYQAGISFHSRRVCMYITRVSGYSSSSSSYLNKSRKINLNNFY